MILRHDRESDEDAILEADTEVGAPVPISLYRTYPGEGNAEHTMNLTVAELRWLIEDAGPRLLAALNQER